MTPERSCASGPRSSASRAVAILRRCSACSELHELGYACPTKAERERGRWADQSRRRGPRPYNTRRWHDIAKAAKQRDGFRCRAHGCNETRGLQAHHIDDDPARFFGLENVLTLCTPHHRQAEHERRQGGRAASRRVARKTTAAPRREKKA